MKLRYGLNEADEWWDFAMGPKREEVWQRFREIDTRVIRIFLFDKGGPDPVTDWRLFTSYVEAVLNVGAVPMITFAKFRRPFDDPRALRWFANQCGDVVWNCIEQWGPEEVRGWYWCVWNEPNSDWIGGGLTFDQYKAIYEAVAREAVRWLSPYLNGIKPKVGGPAVEGFQPFWMDWVWRFVHEIDNSLIGFVDWHHYGDWREHGENGAPLDPDTHRALIMHQAQEYEARARAIGRLLEGRDIENICGELNTHSHYWDDVRARFNQSVFGAAFYTSAVLHLIRGGADVEMFWTGTDVKGGYGMMIRERATPVFHAKKLLTEYVRPGDRIAFATLGDPRSPIDLALAYRSKRLRAGIVVHRAGQTAAYQLSRVAPEARVDWSMLRKIDEATGEKVMRAVSSGEVRFDGFGVAVLTRAEEPGSRGSGAVSD